jgi:hypothetical protein
MALIEVVPIQHNLFQKIINKIIDFRFKKRRRANCKVKLFTIKKRDILEGCLIKG